MLVPPTTILLGPATHPQQNSTRIHDNVRTKLKQIIHTDKKQEQTVHIYTQLANKNDIRPVFLSFLTPVVLLR